MTLGWKRFSFLVLWGSVVGIAACVGDAPVVTPPNGSDASTNDASSSNDAAPPKDASVEGGDASVCSAAPVGNTVTATSGSSFSTNGTPFVAGDWILTSALASCNGACSFPVDAKFVGGLRMVSTGGTGVVIERHIEVVQGSPKYTLVDRLTGDFLQANDQMTLKSSCGGPGLSDAGSEVWSARFPAAIGDGGAVGTFRVQMPGMFVTTSQGPNATVTMTFTKK
jgi:hypothetical protein